jgi:hypothetical protein
MKCGWSTRGKKKWEVRGVKTGILKGTSRGQRIGKSIEKLCCGGPNNTVFFFLP